MSNKPHIFIVAGESSGDLLGAELLDALAARRACRLRGIGGPAMAARGFASLFPMGDIAVIGLWAIFTRLPHLLARVRETANAILADPPDCVVLIDSPEFTHRVARRVKAARPDLCVICYVAPQVWGWRRERARRMAAYIDHILALLPFEPRLFRAAGGPPTSYVGHPVLARRPQKGSGKALRARHNIAADTPLLAVLPGSRMSEVTSLLPIFMATLGQLAAAGEIRVAIPLVPHVAERVRQLCTALATPPLFLETPEEKLALFDTASAALAASGTATLELALAGVPTIVAYRVDPLLAWAARRVSRAPSLVLANLILDRPAMLEFIQERCRADLLAPAVTALLFDAAANRAARAALADLPQVMQADGGQGSARAAQIVLQLAAG